MKTINVLDASIFNRIAAGEVVENPRSIVKELVENSIDAGADTITVEIRGGGIAYIAVSDNGKGLSREDMALAFLPHATSKIASVDDLDAIRTLGFRGEALPSIASVASVEMVSRMADNELGYTMALQNGKIMQEGECGAPYGTKVVVRNLFADIPARAKFLRKPQAEEGSITEFIEKMILSNPSIKFKYVADGEIVYHSSGTDAKSALFELYGTRFVDNTEEVLQAQPDVTVRGLIGKPNFTKHNRTYQTLVVNGRYVVNSEFSYCIQQCYQPYLMKRQFPVYLLYIDLPADRVDVNVHPNKMDVRFADERLIKGIVYNLVKKTVDRLAAEPMQFLPPLSDEPFVNEPKPAESAATLQKNEAASAFEPILPKVHAYSAPLPRETKVAESTPMRARLNELMREYKIESRTNAQPNGASVRIPAMPKIQPPHYEQADIGLQAEVRYAGKLFNTYLLIEKNDDVYLIDQHAAHEKLL
ncbi:MAG: DNA mismatch repair endonuclease MutL, partial [Clostridiales bacterium]|nr:DNA mismatch repair endonuclease MutL [Clostridiales bacterium]